MYKYELGYEVGDLVAVFYTSHYDTHAPMLGKVTKIMEKSGQITVVIHEGEKYAGRVMRFKSNGSEVGESAYSRNGWRLVYKAEMVERFNAAKERNFERVWFDTLKTGCDTIMREAPSNPSYEERGNIVRKLFDLANKLDERDVLKAGPVVSLDELFTQYERELKEKAS